MPHVEIKCFPGRSAEQKKKCADKIAEDIAEIIGCKTSSVSVAITEVSSEEWKEKVWNKDIAPKMDLLVKMPGYTC